MEGRDPPGVLAQGPHVPLTSNFQGTLAPSREVLSLSLASSCPPSHSADSVPRENWATCPCQVSSKGALEGPRAMSGRGPGPGDQPVCVLTSLPRPCPDVEVDAALTHPRQSGVGTVVFKLPDVELAVLAVTSEEKMRRWGFSEAVTGARDYRVLITPTLCRLFWITLPNLPCPTSVSLPSYGKGMTPAPRGPEVQGPKPPRW